MQPNNITIKYFVYCRKSSEDNKERQMQSIESQERELTRTIQEQGLLVAKTFKEEKSAHTRGRPIFNEMLTKLENGEANAILTYHGNRLARNAFDGGWIITAMDEGKIREIKTPHRTYYNTPDDKFFLQLEFGISKKDSDDKSVVVKRGLKAKCEKGWMPGVAPMGYLNTPQLVGGSRYILKDEERFDLIRKAWEMMASGTHQVSEIQRIMNEDWKFRTRTFKRQGLVYFSPAVPERRLAFNMLDNPGVEPHLIVSGVIGVFKKIWAPDFWGPRMEHIFRNALWALTSTGGTTLADVQKILLDRDYRRQILKNVADGPVKDFWLLEFAKYPPMFREEAIAPILNKLGAFLSNPYIREVISQPKSAFNLRKIMDEGGIFVANLSKGRLGEDASRLLGSMLATQFELAALSRANMSETERRDFYLYIDEFPAVVTNSFSTVLAESRKYGLNLILAMQFLDQLEEQLRNAVFENIGSLIAFRVGPESARILARELEPEFNEADLMNLPRYHIYLRLMVNGVASMPFSARTITPLT